MGDRNKKEKSHNALLKAFIISGVLLLIVVVVEGVFAFTTGSMPICITLPGGDCTEYLGIGWKILTLYPSVSSDDPVQHISTVTFDPLILILFVLIWGLIMVVTGGRVPWHHIKKVPRDPSP